MAHICIITSGQLASNPRTVKEANALSAAGHDVTVISTKVLASVEPRDLAILATAPWQVRRVDFGARLPRIADRLLQIAATKFHALTGARKAVFWSHSAMTRRLSGAATQVKADLYIAHYVAALPAAAAAAHRYGVPFGFDAEDFHPGDLSNTPDNHAALRAIGAIEQNLLPKAAYITAASPGIARAYAQTYAIPEPQVVLNTFPLSQAPSAMTPLEIVTADPSLYWFSQTIGPDRGLEAAVRAIARSKHRPRLCLRGEPSIGYVEKIGALAADCGVTDRVEFLPPAAPGEMERLAAEHTLGLVAETGHTTNRGIALTNKQFTYLLAGLPALMSDVEAHREFARGAEGAAFLFRTDDPSSLADVIDSLLDDQDRLKAARLAAYRLGQEKYNWENEQAKLLAPISAALGSL